jgi:predicted dienelactone hydrolase
LIGAMGASLLPRAAATQGPTRSDDTWLDARRARALPLRLRWPAGDAPCAAMVYSHGLGGSRDGGDVWGRAWAATGFLVLHLQHPGSDTEALRGGVAALRAAASAEQLAVRVADVIFVLDEIERRAQRGDPPWSRVRADAIGAAGHSFGARTVQALAGQRFTGVPAARLAEPRLKAFVALSPSMGRDPALPEHGFGGVARPFLCVTGSLDGDPLGGERSGDHRRRVYDGLPAGRRALLWLDGADHMTFAGNAEQRLRARFGPLKREGVAIEREAVHHAIVARTTTAWWRAQLLGEPLRAPEGLGAADHWRME